MSDLRSVPSTELSPGDRADLRRLFAVAWPDGDFGEADWDHAQGGVHWLLEVDGRIVSHASVVERVLEVAGSVATRRPLVT